MTMVLTHRLSVLVRCWDVLRDTQTHTHTHTHTHTLPPPHTHTHTLLPPPPTHIHTHTDLGEGGPDDDGADSQVECPGQMLGRLECPAQPLQTFAQHVLPVDSVRHAVLPLLFRSPPPLLEAAVQQPCDQVLVGSATEHRYVEVMSTGVGDRTWVCRGHVYRCWWALRQDIGMWRSCLQVLVRQHGMKRSCSQVLVGSVREHGYVFTGYVEVMSTDVSGLCNRTWVCVYWVCRGHVYRCWWAL